MHLKILSAKWRPLCPGGDELTAIYQESAVYGNETEVKLAHKKCQQSSVFHIHLHIFVYTQE